MGPQRRPLGRRRVDLGSVVELGNPCEGPGAETTYDSQSTFVIAVAGTDRYIYMGDRWNPADAADGRYVWLPVRFEGDGFRVEWRDRWRWEE